MITRGKAVYNGNGQTKMGEPPQDMKLKISTSR